MTQTSTTILSGTGHKVSKSGTVISFIASDHKIKSNDSSVAFPYVQYDIVTVTGSANNNSTFTVKSVASDNSYIIVEETVVDESVGNNLTVDHTGFVTNKYKGDGYYSQPDGVHTVAYQVSADFNANATIKMQGTLATTPAEDDWFDISDTTFTADTSTVTSSANFTGNYVWVRSKIMSVTAGTVNSILLNN